MGCCQKLANAQSFFKLYAFILLTSNLVPGINYFVVTTHPLHQLQVWKRSSSSCYMIETYNTRHRFPVIEPWVPIFWMVSSGISSACCLSCSLHRPFLHYVRWSGVHPQRVEECDLVNLECNERLQWIHHSLKFRLCWEELVGIGCWCRPYCTMRGVPCYDWSALPRSGCRFDLDVLSLRPLGLSHWVIDPCFISPFSVNPAKLESLCSYFRDWYSLHIEVKARLIPYPRARSLREMILLHGPCSDIRQFSPIQCST